MQIHQVEQQSDEWFELRKLRLTASNAQAIGNNGKGLETYVTELMAEHLSSGDKTYFGNRHTDRGNELEEFAREVYELETGNKVEKVGFISEGEYVGCSPDGLIGGDGIVEFKAPDDVKYYKLIISGEKEIDTSYLWQVQMGLLLTQRKYAHLAFYNPNFRKNILVFKVLPDQEKQEALRKGIENGIRLIKEHLETFEERVKDTEPRIIGQEPEEELVLVYEGNRRTGSFKLPRINPNKKK